MSAPLLDKPTKGWKADLPLPHVSPDAPLLPIGTAPNCVTHIYLELHASNILGRGAGLVFAIFMFGLATALVKYYFIDSGLSVFLEDFPLSMVALGLLVVCTGGAVYGIRTDIQTPREEPVRFNCKRRKVYVYRAHEGWVFSKKNWGVRPVVYNWDDLRAEAWSRMGPTTSAVPIVAWGVDIAVVEPGTNHVIDRFQLAGSNANGEHMWAMARAFMNQGPEALPKYPHPPRDWNNDVPWYNLPLRLAPKVEWPADIDHESRTAPKVVSASKLPCRLAGRQTSQATLTRNLP